MENFYASLNHPFQLRSNLSYRLFCIFAACFHCSAAFSLPPLEPPLLIEHYLEIEQNLLHSPMLRPLQISSSSNAEHLSGDIDAVMDFDFPQIIAIAGSSERWCEVMLLLSNCQACRVLSKNNHDTLVVNISANKTADIASTPPTEFRLHFKSTKADYLDAGLVADEGPMGTRNIELNLQAIPLSKSRSFVHLHYTYDTQWLSRIAMQTYLQTAGRGKVGFSWADDANTTSTRIGGVRGVIERNTMRYFLGFECALKLRYLSAPLRFRSMSQCWYEQVEKYPIQLHEMQSTEYLDMKSIEYGRQGKTIETSPSKIP